MELPETITIDDAQNLLSRYRKQLQELNANPFAYTSDYNTTLVEREAQFSKYRENAQKLVAEIQHYETELDRALRVIPFYKSVV